jgi:pyruvate kinase
MVARGDLGMEIPPQKVFVAQKWMIKKALAAGKPIVTATQMLESMINKPRPTRAEASDVANAVLDGTDCVMLSGETANGAFPLNALSIMGQTCVEAENCMDLETAFWNRAKGLHDIPSHEALAVSAVQMSFELRVNLIIVFTISGDMARLVS